MDKKQYVYTMSLSKHTEHYETQVQVEYYSGHINGDVSCPNCDKKETAAHTCLCLNRDRVRLFTEGVVKLKIKQEKTNTEISCWLPMYMKHRGTK